MSVAALFVQTDGIYFGLPDVDPWDEARDARLYDGPYPVVAHPPCSTWCQLASVNEARWGKQIGDDGGCFATALDAVEEYGGVLEHPAYSLAWAAFNLPRPQRGSWQRDLWHYGWVTEVSQSAYGCPARKRTWLYYFGAYRKRTSSRVTDSAQLSLDQPPACDPPHLFSGLGLERCEHETVRGNRCTRLGIWDGLSAKNLCTDHADEPA